MLDKLKNRYEDTMTFSGGASIAGFGGSAAMGVERTSISNNQAVIKKDMIELGQLIWNQLKGSVIIQLKNLDIGDSFSDNELKVFLNSIRDTVQVSISYTLPLLSISEIRNVFEKRVASIGYG